MSPPGGLIQKDALVTPVVGEPLRAPHGRQALWATFMVAPSYTQSCSTQAGIASASSRNLVGNIRREEGSMKAAPTRGAGNGV